MTDRERALVQFALRCRFDTNQYCEVGQHAFTPADFAEVYRKFEKPLITAENKTTPHNRTIRFNFPILGERIESMEVKLAYVEKENEGNRIDKAVILDNIIIPKILEIFE